MTERQKRRRVPDSRPPSLSMRWRLRRAWYAIARLLRELEYRTLISPGEAAEVVQALEMARRALARDGAPAWMSGLGGIRLPELAEAVGALKLARDHLAAIDIVWKRRLRAAGLDPRWPGSDD